MFFLGDFTDPLSVVAKPITETKLRSTNISPTSSELSAFTDLSDVFLSSFGKKVWTDAVSVLNLKHHSGGTAVFFIYTSVLTLKLVSASRTMLILVKPSHQVATRPHFSVQVKP